MTSGRQAARVAGSALDSVPLICKATARTPVFTSLYDHAAMQAPHRKPRCIVIAGPNGAGKTTFAKEFLLAEAGVSNFVNADLIAGGLSPLRPEAAAIAAARLFVAELDRMAEARMDFAFETTLSGRSHAVRLRRWRSAGYRIELIFLRLPSPTVALRRVAARVRQGGHDVPRADILRRYARGWDNFQALYRSHVDAWAVYDNSGKTPQLLEWSR